MGVKQFAPCELSSLCPSSSPFPQNDPVATKVEEPTETKGYESSPTTGDAACSLNGTVYPDSDSPFSIPSTDSSNASTSATTPYAKSSTKSSTPTTTSASIIYFPVAGNSPISASTGTTVSRAAVLFQQVAANPGLNTTGLIANASSYGGALRTGMGSAPQATFMGGVGKLGSGTLAVGAGICGAMAIFA